MALLCAIDIRPGKELAGRRKFRESGGFFSAEEAMTHAYNQGVLLNNYFPLNVRQVGWWCEAWWVMLFLLVPLLAPVNNAYELNSATRCLLP